MTTFDELVEQLQQKLDEVAEAGEAEYQRGQEDGYQDGLNDALRFIAEYRERAAKDPECTAEYREGLDDAVATLEENGAEDVTAASADSGDVEEAVPSHGDGGSVPAAPVQMAEHADDDVAEA